VLPETGSTNAIARAAALDGAVHGAAFAAELQTAGRGRLGRVWQSPTGNLAISFVLRPNLTLSQLPLLVLAAGVAAVEAIGEPVRLKWPNDLIDPAGRKVGGILAETDVSTAGRFVIVGFGVNVGAHPEDLPATHLRLLVPEPPTVPELAASIGMRLIERVAAVQHDPAHIVAAWRAYDATVGRTVRVGEVEGVATGLGPDGSLWVRDRAGEVQRILAGDVVMVAG
jgi:BirA family biotin operon repressor/biotin-[acetyl-CoA-carboxylase] ligase